MTGHLCKHCTSWGSLGLSYPMRTTGKTDWCCHFHYLRQPEGQAMIINRILEIAA